MIFFFSLLYYSNIRNNRNFKSRGNSDWFFITLDVFKYLCEKGANIKWININPVWFDSKKYGYIPIKSWKIFNIT